MGFITNQWLKGNPERNRAFAPVAGDITAAPSRDGWSKDRDVVVDITVRRPDGNFQQVLLTSQEVDSLMPTMIETGGAQVRLQMAVSTFAKLPDGELLDALSKIFTNRGILQQSEES